MDTPEEMLDAVPEMMLRHEFARVIDIIDELVAESEALTDVHPSWYVYRGVAQNLDSRFGDAISSYQMALSIDPDYLQANLNLAYVLACCPDPVFHDAELAIQHAERGCELTNRTQWHTFQILAAAHARAGNFDAANSHAQQANKLAPGTHQWRVTRLTDCFRKQEPYTACIEDDVRKLHTDWENAS